MDESPFRTLMHGMWTSCNVAASCIPGEEGEAIEDVVCAGEDISRKAARSAVFWETVAEYADSAISEATLGKDEEFAADFSRMWTACCNCHV